MIKEHQPTIFDGEILAAVSSIEDGSMRLRPGSGSSDNATIAINRKNFLQKLDIAMEDTVRVRVTYDRDDFCRNGAVNTGDKGKGMTLNDIEVYDALATNQPGIALFLPLADCVGAIFYDPTKQVIMVSHLGRHSTVQNGVVANVEFLSKQFNCLPADLRVWFSPSVAMDDYKLDYFYFKDDPIWQPFCKVTDDGIYIDIAGYNKARLLEAGVLRKNIEISPINTATDLHYPSHRSGDSGRFAIVAMMTS